MIRMFQPVRFRSPALGARLIDELKVFLRHPRTLQQLSVSFLIEVLSGELLVTAGDSRKFELDRAADDLKETIFEVALMVRPKDGTARVLASRGETAVIGDRAMWEVHQNSKRAYAHFEVRVENRA